MGTKLVTGTHVNACVHHGGLPTDGAIQVAMVTRTLGEAPGILQGGRLRRDGALHVGMAMHGRKGLGVYSLGKTASIIALKAVPTIFQQGRETQMELKASSQTTTLLLPPKQTHCCRLQAYLRPLTWNVSVNQPGFMRVQKLITNYRNCM